MVYCHICGMTLEMNPDGGYCEACENYYSNDELSDYDDDYDDLPERINDFGNDESGGDEFNGEASEEG